MELISFSRISVVVLGLFRILVSGQYVESPCPDLFQYKSDGGGTHGEVHIRPSSGPVSSLQVRANFTIAARLSTNYVGRLEPIGSAVPLLRNFNRGVPINYRVTFPVTSPMPRLTALIVNGDVICYGPGDVPGPGEYVTTTSLQHTLFREGQGGFNQFDEQPSKDPEIDYHLSSLPGDTQVFTFGDSFDDGDRRGSWNSIYNNYPYYLDDTPRPQYELPSVPKPQYHYPMLTTPPPRPRPPPTPPVTFAPPPRLPIPSRPAPDPADIQCGRISEAVGLIYNGQSYPRGAWPWLTALYKRSEGGLNFICAGTLVSARHVVTAAHCMHQNSAVSSRKDIVVKVGVYNLEDWGEDNTFTRTVESAYIHESFNASSLENDILVLTLERTVEFSLNVRPACLWTGNPDLSRVVGATGVVAGWGRSEEGPAGRGTPRVVRMPIVSTDTCRASRPDFHKLTSSNTLCAGDRNDAGPCLGDSGGGLYMIEDGLWHIRGVVSLSLRPDNGDNSCNLKQYIVFTDAAQYAAWIKNAMTN